MVVASCLEDAELNSLALGDTDDETMEARFLHLDQCASCQERFTRISLESDPLVQAFQAPVRSAGKTLGGDATAISRWRKIEFASESNPVPWGSWFILRPLGAGGMGQVYLARHATMQRLAALKLVPPDLISDPFILARFKREACAFASINHPHVVTAYDASDVEGVPYIAMEYLEGPDLAQLIHDHGPLDPVHATEIIRQVALGLAHLHSRNLVHRDVKPGNIMLSGNGVTKLLDFGIIKDTFTSREPLTDFGRAIGTRVYSAPEQLTNGSDVDSRADIYSLGVTLMTLLTGRPADNTRSLPPNVPESLRELIDRMLAPDRDARWPDCGSLAKALERWSGDERMMHELVSKARQVALAGDEISSGTRMQSSWPASYRATLVTSPEKKDTLQPRNRLRWWFELVLIVLVLCGGFAYFRSPVPVPMQAELSPLRGGKNFEEWLRLTQDASNVNEAGDCIENSILLADTPDRQRQVATTLVGLTLQRDKPDPYLVSPPIFFEFSTMLTKGLNRLPPEAALPEVIRAFASDDRRAQVFSASFLWRARSSDDGSLASAARSYDDEILRICEGHFGKESHFREVFFLYNAVCESKQRDVFASPAFMAFAEGLVEEPVDTRELAMRGPVNWIFPILIGRGNDLKVSLALSRILALNEQGFPLTMEQLEWCLTQLERCSEWHPSVAMEIERGCRRLVSHPFDDKSFWWMGGTQEPHGGPALIVDRMLRLLSERANADGHLTEWFRSIERDLDGNHSLSRLRSTVRRISGSSTEAVSET